jgi:hypothetical protein
VETADPAVAASGRAEATLESQPDRSVKDMALSLAVLLVPIALVFGFYQLVLDGNEPPVIDPQPAVAQARAAGAFPVSEPAGLDGGWRPVTAVFRQEEGGQTLRIGYLSPSGQGVQVVQSTVPAEQLLSAELTTSAQPHGTVELAGRTWQRYRARPGEYALVLLEPDRTVIVVGSAEEGELRHLAVNLR